MASKSSTRRERRHALREMAHLMDRKQILLSSASSLTNSANASEHVSLIKTFLEKVEETDRMAAQSSLVRPYSEADLIDKAVVFFTGGFRDVALVLSAALLAALIMWLIVTGQLAGAISSLFISTFGILAAVAVEPGLVLRDRQAVGSLIAALAAFVVALAFIVFSISWFFTHNAAKRKEARDFLTLIVTFFVGILTGWAL